MQWQTLSLISLVALATACNGASTPVAVTAAKPKAAATHKVSPSDTAPELLEPEAVLLAVEDLVSTHGTAYTNGADYLRRLKELAPRVSKLRDATHDKTGQAELQAFQTLAREALLANPAIDADQIVLVKRSNNNLGLPPNWSGNSSIPREGYDNEIVLLSRLRTTPQLETLYKPSRGAFVGDLSLAYDASKLLFSMPGGNNGRWHLWEIQAKPSARPKRLTRITDPDVDAYDGCYLPDGGIVFMCNATYQGVPCVAGQDYVANLYRMDADGTNMRRLCYDQEMNWSPMVMNDGRVMYTRWEYTDTAHYFTRLLFSMNPDGTGQQALYGSNSYWPNSLFYARQIPGAPSKIVGIVSGHHGEARKGELVLFDLTKGRAEADGVVQRIPGRGKPVEPRIVDKLVDGVYPRFLHPQPLNEKYFLVSCQPRPKAPWGVYLVDVFDNSVLLCELPGHALLEPVLLKATTPPPIIPDHTVRGQTEATVILSDVYAGPGLAGVPRGTIKRLRIFSYHFTYRDMGSHDLVGIESGWEIKRILGTVPVEADGSANFRIPANTPIAIQPLDEKGQAVQLMRSWFTGQPGEVVSCTGCHEAPNSAPPPRGNLALKRPPSKIEAWYGPSRPFAFTTEVQPVLDRNCISCHNGNAPKAGRPLANFVTAETPANYLADKAYLELHRFVRRPGPESDYHLLKPMEYHASTSELMQLLDRGHHGVALSKEDRERLATWIDLNAPWRGAWTPRPAQEGDLDPVDRRRELALRYEGFFINPDLEYAEALAKTQRTAAPQTSAPLPQVVAHPPLKTGSWPFDAARAKELQNAAGTNAVRTLDLGNGIAIELAYVPAGQYATKAGSPDGKPRLVEIRKGFWMGRTEISNEQFRQFNPRHDSRYIDQQSKDHTIPGYPANLPSQPVIRVTQAEARQFCEWFSQKSRARISLPSEEQWEWACRAGSDSDFWFGTVSGDFSKHANLADRSLKRFAVRGVNPQPVPNPGPNDAFLPRADSVDDQHMISAPVGSYLPNPLGLFDMHGNVAEWTSSVRPDPLTGEPTAVVRGGSWIDRPERATASFGMGYREWQPVFNVGFRIILEQD